MNSVASPEIVTGRVGLETGRTRETSWEVCRVMKTTVKRGSTVMRARTRRHDSVALRRVATDEARYCRRLRLVPVFIRRSVGYAERATRLLLTIFCVTPRRDEGDHACARGKPRFQADIGSSQKTGRTHDGRLDGWGIPVDAPQPGLFNPSRRLASAPPWRRAQGNAAPLHPAIFAWCARRSRTSCTTPSASVCSALVGRSTR